MEGNDETFNEFLESLTKKMPAKEGKVVQDLVDEDTMAELAQDPETVNQLDVLKKLSKATKSKLLQGAKDFFELDDEVPLETEQQIFGAPKKLAAFLLEKVWVTPKAVLDNKSSVMAFIFKDMVLAKQTKEAHFWQNIKEGLEYDPSAMADNNENLSQQMLQASSGRELQLRTELLTKRLYRTENKEVERFTEARTTSIQFSEEKQEWVDKLTKPWRKYVSKEGFVMCKEVLNYVPTKEAPPSWTKEVEELKQTMQPIMKQHVTHLGLTLSQIENTMELQILVVLYSKLAKYWLAGHEHSGGQKRVRWAEIDAFICKGSEVLLDDFNSFVKKRGHGGTKSDTTWARTAECFKCKEKGHLSKDCNRPFQGKCNKCGKQGHKAAFCSTRGDSRLVGGVQGLQRC